MKNIALLLVTIPLLLISCTRNPLADFTASATGVEIGETIYFTNRSIDAESFEWDFGDGFVSNSFNASHYYDLDGVYTVSLKAITSRRVDIAYMTVNVIRNLTANFTVSAENVGIGETIYFTNSSTDAESFEWDFGDGFVSGSKNASHFYDIDGVYNVSLKAIYNSSIDVAYMTVNVIGASLEITVEEFYTPFYVVPDISVILYATVQDWENPNTSPKVAEGFTNASGVVLFDHLAPQRYYVDVYGPNHDNYKLAEEDVGFIETPVLVPGTITTWTALVDYYPAGKKSSLSRFELRAQRKIEASEHAPRIKAERK